MQQLHRLEQVQCTYTHMHLSSSSLLEKYILSCGPPSPWWESSGAGSPKMVQGFRSIRKVILGGSIPLSPFIFPSLWPRTCLPPTSTTSWTTSYQRNDANLVSFGRAQVPKASDEVPKIQWRNRCSSRSFRQITTLWRDVPKLAIIRLDYNLRGLAEDCLCDSSKVLPWIG